MNLFDIKKVLAGPYKAEIVEMDGTECAVCSYMNREFWVYLMPDETVEQLVFSFITEKSVAELPSNTLNEFHESAHVARIFYDEKRHLNLNAKLVGKIEDLSVGSFVMFLEAWMSDFDRLLPTLRQFDE